MRWGIAKNASDIVISTVVSAIIGSAGAPSRSNMRRSTGRSPRMAEQKFWESDDLVVAEALRFYRVHEYTTSEQKDRLFNLQMQYVNAYWDKTRAKRAEGEDL